MNLNVKLNLLIIGQRWRSTPGEMSNTWWCSSRFCTGTLLFLIYIYVKKTNTPFWNSADEQNLKLLTFKQSHVYNTSAFFYPPNFHRYGVVYSGTILAKKKCVSIIFDFSLFYWCSTTLIYYVILIMFAYRLWF